jgi:DNA-binding transcriptional ArsR family regulator
MRVDIRFQPRDLANIRFSVSPIAHLVTGALETCPHPSGQRWWRSVRGRVPAAAAPLLELVNAKPLFTPDFMTPSIPLDHRGPAPSIADELDVLRTVAPERVAEELHAFDDLPAPPRIVVALREDSRAVAQLADSVLALYRACLADDWPDIERHLRTDIAYRTAVLADRGVEAMLDSLAPGQAGPETLTVFGPCQNPASVAIELDGRGFLLSANRFHDQYWSLAVNRWDLPFLVYPAAHRASASAPSTRSGADPLATLIGRGRATALRAIGGGCTTGELAARLAVSAPTASAHATTLRDAGLVDSARDGRRVVHTVTVLGAGLLVANPGFGE